MASQCTNNDGSSITNSTISPPSSLRCIKRKLFSNKEEPLLPSSPPMKDEEPILSILNLVVDHVMVAPSPLEPDEFQWHLRNQAPIHHLDETNNDENKENILVPVLRIFGPITRLSTATTNITSTSSSTLSSEGTSNLMNNIKSDKYQTGCLHIHGAFPYLLARPVQAGPDGFTTKYPNEKGNDDPENRFHIDWNNPASVSLITDQIRESLEQLIRSSLDFSAEPSRPTNDIDNGNETNGDFQGGEIDRPPERFIRCVTVICGRGFYTFCSGTIAPFLRVEYYDPSHRWRVKIMMERGLELPIEYHPRNSAIIQDNDEENDAKDITIELLKFQCYEAHIPYTMQFFKDYNLAGMRPVKVGDGRFRDLPLCVRSRRIENENGMVEDESAFFLPNNTHDDLMWENASAIATQEAQVNGDYEFWKKKTTSCDVEYDTTVSHILNVLDVIETPQNQEQEQWRAVPSLREIWGEERQRMASLLPAKDNFLSKEMGANENNAMLPPKNPSFTLNVKKGASIPGSRLAARGVKNLFNSSPGLEDSMAKAANDIVYRHQESIEQMNTAMQNKNSSRNNRVDEEAFLALQTFGCQFPHGKGNIQSQEGTMTPYSPLSLHESISPSTQATGGLTQADRQHLENEIDFLKQADHDSNSLLNPDTLTPYNDDGEEDDDSLQQEESMEEEEFERSLDILATQAFDPAKRSNQDSQDMTSSLELEHQKAECGMDDRSLNLSTEKERMYGGSVASDFRVNEVCFAQSSSQSKSDEGAGNFYELKLRPPLRSQINDSSHFYPRHNGQTSKEASVEWLGFGSLNSSHASYFLSSTNGSHIQLENNVYIEPSRLPPRLGRVRSWLIRQRMDGRISDTVARGDDRKKEMKLQTSIIQSSITTDSKASLGKDPLQGIGNRGGHIFVEGGGLKAAVGVGASKSQRISKHRKKSLSHLTIMCIEIHVQCRVGMASNTNSRKIAMKPDPKRDAISSICFVHAIDPGNGEKISMIERGCLFMPTDSELSVVGDNLCDNEEEKSKIILSKLKRSAGVSGKIHVEVMTSERELLLRIASLVQWKDPDALVSWDTQSQGLEYLIERGFACGNDDTQSLNKDRKIDMICLLGRTPQKVRDGSLNQNQSAMEEKDNKWTGSVLGAEWDDTVGVGAAAASIYTFRLYSRQED